MKLTVSHVQAAYHWLMTPMDGRSLADLPRSSTLGHSPTRVRELERIDLVEYAVEGLQTEFLVTDASARPRRTRYRYHTSCKTFPVGAFVIVDVGLQIVGPELSFWQMADVLPIGELAKFGNALCARHCYSLDADGRCIKRATPLTTSAKLEKFARAMGTARGKPAAFRALRSVVDGCESPMESAVAVLLCLKRQYGGFGFPKPKMGHVVALDDAGRKIAGRDTCRCDMYWEDAGYDLEYDSKQEHSGAAAFERDAARRMAIRHMGIRVEELRSSQVTDPDLFMLATQFIGAGIGLRRRARPREERLQHEWCYAGLRKQLFSWERRDAGEQASPLHVADLDW